MEENLVITQHGKVTEVSLNRPKAFNAFDLSLCTALADALGALARDASVRAVLLSGKGPAFCAGGDLKWVLAHSGGPPAGFHTLAGQFHRAITEIKRMPKPVVAAIQKVAAGGGFSMALACDFRVMEKNAVLRQAYTASGLCIDGGGTHSLARMVGLARAMEIAAFDAPITAEKALEWGLATKVVEEGTSVSAGLDMCRELAGKALFSFGQVKKLLTDSFDTPLETQLERERAGLASCAAHPEGREGLLSFSEKRKPVFDS